jgi:hypothetical protein
MTYVQMSSEWVCPDATRMLPYEITLEIYDQILIADQRIPQDLQNHRRAKWEMNSQIIFLPLSEQKRKRS